MKILIISPVATHPVNAGNRARIEAVRRILQDGGHQVHLLCLQPGDAAEVAQMRAVLGPRLHLSPYSYRPRYKRQPLRRLLRHVWKLLGSPRGYVYEVDDWYDDRVDALVRRLQAQHRFEGVIVHYAFLTRALQQFDAAVLKLCDTHFVSADRHLLDWAAGRKPRWFSATPRSDRLALQRVDITLTVSQADEDHYRRALPGRRALFVGHICELPAKPAAAAADCRNILFVGSATNSNAAGVNHFIAQVLPRVLAAHPDARLLVAGAVGSRVAEHAAVDRLGIVADLEPLYAQAAVAINPVLVGDGLSIKTIEALAHGMATVATDIGARGLDMFIGRGLQVSAPNAPAAMARQIIALFDDPAARLAAGEAAAAAAAEWNRSNARKLLDAMQVPARA